MTKNRINVKEMEIKMWFTQRLFRLARLLAIIGQITSYYYSVPKKSLFTF